MGGTRESQGVKKQALSLSMPDTCTVGAGMWTSSARRSCRNLSTFQLRAEYFEITFVAKSKSNHLQIKTEER